MKCIGFVLGSIQGNGGIARVVSLVANELVKNPDINVHIISFSIPEAEADYRYDERIIMHRLYDSRVSMTTAILKKHAIKKLAEIIDKNDIDIIVACGELFFPLSILASKKRNIKCWCWEHSNPAGTTDHKFQAICRKFAVQNADKIIVLTKSAEKYYCDEFKTKATKVIQIYNPVDQLAFSTNRSIQKENKLISVGRLTYQKNFQNLIEIASQVLVDNEWTWDIYGEGEDRKELETMIKERRLSDRIRLMGQVSNLYEVYPKYSIQVMTSRYEGFPMSLLEGEANGLPLVSYDIPTGPNEIIVNNVNGLLVEAGNTDEMVKGIRYLISDSYTRNEMSQNSLEMAKRFTIDSIVKGWEKMIYE